MSEDIAPSVFLIGCGRMGGALLRGWRQTFGALNKISVLEPNPSSEIKAIIDRYHIQERPSSAPDVMILAVKPQIISSTLSEMAQYAGEHTLILSIAAGIKIAALEKEVSHQTAVIRAMPNLPAEIGHGVTALCANAHVSIRQHEISEKLLSAFGKVAWIDDEQQMDAITALSGSGPAYLFYFTECLAEAAIKAGLPSDLAMEFARKTVTGSAALLNQSTHSAVELRANVTSPNGTTAAGLQILMKGEALQNLLIETIQAAAQRSRELGQT